VALQLALSFGITANLVLCTEASGDVAVESAFSAGCCDDHVLPEGARRLSQGDGCGCVDTPLLQSPVEARQRLEYAPPAPHALPSFLVPYPAEPPAIAAAAARGPGAPGGVAVRPSFRRPPGLSGLLVVPARAGDGARHAARPREIPDDCRGGPWTIIASPGPWARGS
jgi:hypothetical protein